MRKVAMPASFVASLRRCRRSIVMIAAGFLVLQALLAGLAVAQAAAQAANPFDAGVICHGTGGADPTDGAPTDTSRHWQLCCAFCTAAAPPVLPGMAPILARFDLGPDVGAPAVCRSAVMIAARAVRAGFSQAPPSLA